MKLVRHTQRLARGIAVLGLALLLGACAGPPRQAALPQIREFAAASAKLDAFADLTLHYRDTYTRELPYLNAAAAAQEKASDVVRRAQYGDFMRIQKSVVLYLETLAKLAGGQQYDLSSRVKNMVGGIKSWPDSGIDTQQAYAYTRLGQLVTGALTSTAQQTAAAAMLTDGAEPLHDLLEAMSALLRYYDKTSDNESDIVLGLFEVELPFLESSQDRLLAALVKVRYAEKKSEFSAVGRRLTLAQKQLQAIMVAHRLLLDEAGRATPPTSAAKHPAAATPSPSSSSAKSTATATATKTTTTTTPLQQALAALAGNQAELSLDSD